MKKAFKLFVTIFALAFISNVSFGQLPTYSLDVNQLDTGSSAGQDFLEFDIDMTWTNSGVAPTFQYAGGQYFFDFNKAAIKAGTTWQMSIASSGIPVPFQPRNPTVYTATTPGQLRWAVNTFPGAGNGLFFAPNETKNIVRVRIVANGGDQNFADNATLDLAFRNGPANPFTKIFCYTVDNVNTDITTAATHTISIQNIPLPVELASFTAVTNRNNVTLNWATSKETNNQGFEVERSLVGANSWAKAGTVTGNGTTNETKSYSFTERVTTGNYSYRLKQIDFNGNFEFHNLSSEVNVGVPSEFALSQNYPNPFNPSTKIDYDIATDGNVSVVLFDMSGREVAKLVNDFKTAGYYTVNFNASNLSSGMYFYRISASNFSQTKKMVLVK
ncbi:MAG: T9SS type A sorting domain-containing protein [Ignavibacteria bacterium]